MVVDSGAQEFVATLDVDRGNVRARLVELLPQAARESARQIVLAQAIPKGQKLDYVIEKVTELGVTRILPVRTERSVAEASENKLVRWRNIARSAAQQSGRTRVPEIDAPVDFAAVVAEIREFDAAIFAWELARAPLRTVLAGIGEAQRVLLIVGPEGGFSHDEAEAAIAAGAHPVSLGPRILRTETAPLVLVTALLYEGGEL